MLPKEQPFWVDEPQPASPKSLLNMAKLFSVSITIFIYGFIVMMLFILYTMFSKIGLSFLGWLIIAVIVVTFIWGISLGVVRRRSTKVLIANVAEIQQRAAERTGASAIGSAIHVAGHPLLKRDQPVVLALAKGQLNIYDYNDPTPIDVLPLADLKSLHTVVYDDERVPHIDVIDSTAQALQIAFLREDQVYTCLFRRMLKMHPIDWYHQIQQARL